MCPLTIPPHFWSTLPAGYRDELAAIDDDGTLVLPTGSRLFCPDDARDDSDWDVFLLATTATQQFMLRRNWKIDTVSAFPSGNPRYPSRSISMRLSTIRRPRSLNAVLFFSREAYRNFAAATEFCLSVGGPPDRDKRVAIFRAFMW